MSRNFLIWFFGSCASFLGFLLRSLPRRWRASLGSLIGLLWFDVFRIRRKVVLNNVAIAFPELTPKQRVTLARKGMCQFGNNIVEYSDLPVLSKQNWDKYFRIEGLEHIRGALAEGRGVLLLTLHLGHGDLAMGGLALKDLPMVAVSKEFKLDWLNELWFGVRRRLGIRFIPPRNSAYGVLKALKQNNVVVFVLDQFTGPPIGVKVTFFGRETGAGVGMATMAERSQAPVVPAYTVRETDGRHRIVVGPPVPWQERGDRDQSLAHMTQVYTDLLETYVRMYPEQWMWLHRRWKTFRG